MSKVSHINDMHSYVCHFVIILLFVFSNSIKVVTDLVNEAVYTKVFHTYTKFIASTKLTL